MKKIQEKYGDQDAEERELRLQLLAVTNSDLLHSRITGLVRLSVCPSVCPCIHSNRPHCRSCPSVRPCVRLSVYLSLCPIETKRRKRSEIGVNIRHGGVTGVPILTSRGQISRSLDVKNLKKMTHISRKDGLHNQFESV